MNGQISPQQGKPQLSLGVQQDVPVAVATGTTISIFIGNVGYNITKPAETTATQFVVIEDVALTPDGPATQTGGLALGNTFDFQVKAQETHLMVLLLMVQVV